MTVTCTFVECHVFSVIVIEINLLNFWRNIIVGYCSARWPRWYTDSNWGCPDELQQPKLGQGICGTDSDPWGPESSIAGWACWWWSSPEEQQGSFPIRACWTVVSAEQWSVQVLEVQLPNLSVQLHAYPEMCWEQPKHSDQNDLQPAEVTRRSPVQLHVWTTLLWRVALVPPGADHLAYCCPFSVYSVIRLGLIFCLHDANFSAVTAQKIVQIHQKNLGMGQTPPPFGRCQDCSSCFAHYE